MTEPESNKASALTSVSSTSLKKEFLEWKSIISASEILAYEFEPAVLKASIMDIVTKITGAQRSILILNKEGDFYLEQEKSVNRPEIIFDENLRLEDINPDDPPLSISIIRYTLRTGKPVILDNPSQNLQFQKDIYLQKKNPLSIFCTPILLKQKIVGVLYLENFSISGAFNKVNIEVLNILSLQIAISLENARLFENFQLASNIWKRMLIFNEGKKELPVEEPRKYLVVKEDTNHYMIPFPDILYITSHNYFSTVHTISREYRSGKNLKELIGELPSENFFRVHKSYILNIDHISYLQYFIAGSYIAFLKTKEQTQIPIGKSYFPILKEKLGID